MDKTEEKPSNYTQKWLDRRNAREYQTDFYPDLIHSKAFLELGLHQDLIVDEFWVDNKQPTPPRLCNIYYDGQPPGRFRHKLVKTYPYPELFKILTDKYPWVLGYVDRHETTCELGQQYADAMQMFTTDELYWTIENMLFDIFTNANYADRVVDLLVVLDGIGKESVKKEV